MEIRLAGEALLECLACVRPLMPIAAPEGHEGHAHVRCEGCRGQSCVQVVIRSRDCTSDFFEEII